MPGTLLRPEAAFTASRGLVAGVPRREVKYFLVEVDAGKVRDILRTNCRPGEPYSEARVTSVYFDDWALGSYRDNLEGTGERVKVRIRWYDDRDRSFFLETKRRRFWKSIKDRIALESPIPLTSLRYQAILDRLKRVLPDASREQLLAGPNPILATRYHRSYFVAPDGGVRVTLDTELEWFDQCGRVKPSFRFPARLPRLAILEVKMDGAEGDEEAPGEVLYPLRLRPTRSSKYAVGCRELGLVRDSRGGYG